jgi:hypothetical protein
MQLTEFTSRRTSGMASNCAGDIPYFVATKNRIDRPENLLVLAMRLERVRIFVRTGEKIL